MMMHKKDCFFFGTIFKLHGYKGEINIYYEENIIIEPSLIKYLLLEINYELVPFFIETIRIKKPNIILVKFEDVNTEKEAKILINKKIYLPKNIFQKLRKGKTKNKDLVGYRVLDLNYGELGKVSYINSKTAQRLLYVEKDGKEFCFPMHDEFIKKILNNKRIIEVEIPKDLIYLNE